MNPLFRRTGVVACLVMLLGINSWAQQASNAVTVPIELVSYPDRIVYNAKIVTMDDPSLTNASPGKIVEAMAVKGDRIHTLGSNTQVLRLAGPQTRTIDLKGRTVVPGLIEPHNHLHNGAVNEWIQKNPGTIESIVKRFSVTGNTFQEITRGIELVVKEQMAHPMPGQWANILLPQGDNNTGIGVQYLTQNGMTREQLDQLAPKLPVMIEAHPGFLCKSLKRLRGNGRRERT